MDSQTLMDLVMAGLGVAAAPIIILFVNIAKRFGLKSDDAPLAAATIGIVLGSMLAFEIGGTSVLSALVGIAAGINIGYAAVGLHTSNKKKKLDETGIAHID
jgi:hypothetical protein